METKFKVGDRVKIVSWEEAIKTPQLLMNLEVSQSIRGRE